MNRELAVALLASAAVWVLLDILWAHGRLAAWLGLAGMVVLLVIDHYRVNK